MKPLSNRPLPPADSPRRAAGWLLAVAVSAALWAAILYAVADLIEKAGL